MRILHKFIFFLTNFGVASIVSVIVILVLSYSVKGIETMLDGAINEMINKLDVLPEAKACKIVHIFENRRTDKKSKKCLIEQFEKQGPNKKVLIMSNSLREFLGPVPENQYIKVIYGMLKKGVVFYILLLDPTSDAAKARAVVEEEKRVKKEGYINSTLFREIKTVVERLDNPSSWVNDDDLIKRIEKQIEVRFFPHDPTTHLIRTNKFMFIEQYHSGGDEEIRCSLEAEGIPFIDCFGGFVPVLMVENSSFFAKLMKSHFNNIWNSDAVKERDLRKNSFFEKILSFEEMEKTSPYDES